MIQDCNIPPIARGIIILGMHRSGTSAITRGLQALGADLGENFLETRFDNPTGYWEDKGIVELQDRVLSLLGMTWEDACLIADKHWRSVAIGLYVSEARHYLASQFMRRPLWAFKDPRTLRLLPMWREVLAGLAIQDSYLLVLRNPLSVAESLYRRQAMDHATAHRLSLAYVVPHLDLMFDRRLTVVDYDLFLNDPAAQLDRLANHLQIPRTPNTAVERANYLSKFLQVEMRHTCFDAGDLANALDVPAVSKDAYSWLRRLATDELTSRSPEFLAAWPPLAAATRALLAAG